MPTFRFDRFLRPAVLRSIDPDRLVSYLHMFKDYLLSQGLVLRGKQPLSPAQFDQLVRILGTPTRDTPRDLLDSMHLVTEMANSRCMEIILTRIDASDLGLSKMANPTPADVAMQAWINKRHVVEAIHAEQSLVRTRSFESFQCMSNDVPEIRDLSSEEHYEACSRFPREKLLLLSANFIQGQKRECWRKARSSVEFSSHSKSLEFKRLSSLRQK